MHHRLAARSVPSARMNRAVAHLMHRAAMLATRLEIVQTLCHKSLLLFGRLGFGLAGHTFGLCDNDYIIIFSRTHQFSISDSFKDYFLF